MTVALSDSEKEEIADVRGSQQGTRRAVSAGLEDILHEALPVLDHGFIRVVDYMGDDSSVVQAARVSYGRGTRRRNGSEVHLCRRERRNSAGRDESDSNTGN